MVNGKNLIGLNELERSEVERILELCADLKSELKSGKQRKSLAGKSIAMIFEKQSTRTRVSFQVGITQLGGHPLFLAGTEMQLSRGEPIKDTARVLSRYVDAIVIRANRHDDVAELAKWSAVPVVNGLTDLLHPCQILADLFTLYERGKNLDALKVVFVGDGNNVANSWINAAALFNFELRLACPEGYDPDRSVMEAAIARGARIEIVRDPLKAAAGADVLYTDVWVSMGQDEEKEKRLRDFKSFQIDSRLLGVSAADAVVMHCLPAHRGEEITDEVIEGPHSMVFDEAENRLHVQKAVLHLLAGGDGDG